MRNRLKVAEAADWIVPGHGPKFQVTEHIRNSLLRQAENATNFVTNSNNK